MQVSLEKILGKPNDYWICECTRINWYENEICSNCHKPIQPKDSDTNEKEVLDFIKKELDFYMEEYDYTENEAFNVNIEI